MILLDHDQFDRTALVGLVDGSQPSLEAALTARRRFGIRIFCAPHTDVPAAAATLTAVVAAVRIAGVVLVALPDPDTTVSAGPFRGRTLRDAVNDAGAHLADLPPTDVIEVQQWVELRLAGAVQPRQDVAAVLHVHWDGWTAHVGPTPPPTPASGNVLAAIAAAALAVHEAYGIFSNRPGRDDGYRDTVLDLWVPVPGLAPHSAAPVLAWAPVHWWLVGLGHLGQANAWVLAWLLHGQPGAEIILQDDAVISSANHSTGVFATHADVGQHKTRLTARHLEQAGLRTRIIEQRFDADDPIPAAQRRHVALFGVDNLDVRRSITGSGFEFSVDAGLGTAPGTFDSILIHRFPGSGDSAAIPSWQPDPGPVAIPDTPAFAALLQQHDICGITELAGTAVGASFVGLTAAVLTVTETLRTSHGGAACSPLRVDLSSTVTTGASAHHVVEPPVARLHP